MLSAEEEHKQYHLEVALEGCGVEGCDFGEGLRLHFEALNEEDLMTEEEWWAYQAAKVASSRLKLEEVLDMQEPHDAVEFLTEDDAEDEVFGDPGGN